MSEPLSLRAMRDLYDGINERQRQLDEAEQAWGERYRSDPEYRRQYDATSEVCVEMGLTPPSPSRPLIVHPQLGAEIERRVNEKLGRG